MSAINKSNLFQNSVRHNLSLNKAFCKLERPDGTSQRKGCLWSLKPEKKDQLRREIRKWKKKHPEAIKASMANPGTIDFLFFSSLNLFINLLILLKSGFYFTNIHNLWDTSERRAPSL